MRPRNGYCVDCEMDWRLCVHGGGGMLAVTSEGQRVHVDVYRDGKRVESSELGAFLGRLVERIEHLERVGIRGDVV